MFSRPSARYRRAAAFAFGIEKEATNGMELSGRLLSLFSFDIGHEIRLDAVRELVGDSATGGLSGTRAQPVHLSYATPPVCIELGEQMVSLPMGEEHARVRA